MVAKRKKAESRGRKDQDSLRPQHDRVSVKAEEIVAQPRLTNLNKVV